MSVTGDDGRTDGGRRPTLADRVAISDAGGFAYVPGRLLVRAPAEARARELAAVPDGAASVRTDNTPTAWVRLTGAADPLAAVESLRAAGLEAQPEHVFFAHPCGMCPCPPHPSLAFTDPDGEAGADPFRGHPFRGHPFRGHPFRGHPFRGHPFRGHESPQSTALPAAGRELPPRALSGQGTAPSIVVLDTGLAGGAEPGGAVNADGQCPKLLAAPAKVTGVAERADATITTLSGQSFPPDGYLDPVAGHGTFIAGLIEQLAPGCSIRVEHVTSPLGDVQEFDVAVKILAEVARPKAQQPNILSLSFGGPTLEVPGTLRSAIAAANLAGIVVVASAGNDATCEPQYPAALDTVLAVGAVGPDGPAPFTNYGDWVDASAPGVDLVSAFFKAYDGKFPLMNTEDPDRFAEWARWSGTSFSTPVVVAALARACVEGNCTAKVAVDRVVGAEHLLRLPWLGTVVNL